MFGREKGHDVIARNGRAEIADQMPEVVFFARANGAVGEEHESAAAYQAVHRMVGVDPRVHARGGVELGARRPQLDGQDRRVTPQRLHQRTCHLISI